MTFASNHAISIYARVRNLTPEQNADYRQILPQAIGYGESKHGGPLPKHVTEMVQDWALTSVETGNPLPGHPVDNQQALDDLERRELVRKLRLRDEAQKIIKAEQAPPVETFPAGISLQDLLATPDTEPEYRIERLLPTGGNGILAAQYKAGKTTLRDNLVRSLVDGTPFLGQFTVRPAPVVLIDNELDPRTLKRWLRSHNIRNAQAVTVVSLRGKTSTFDPRDADNRAYWARVIRGAGVVILDCLRPVLDAHKLDENLDAGQFLTAWDELLAEAGVQESIIVHHMGHNGERQRGSSRLLDWPDVTWKIMRENDDPASPRYFSAYGRDVDLPEGGLLYDPVSRHLTYTDGGRTEAKRAYKLPQVLEFLAKSPGTTKTGIKAALPGDDKATAAAVELGIRDGLIEERQRQGRGGGKSLYLTEPPTPVAR